MQLSKKEDKGLKLTHVKPGQFVCQKGSKDDTQGSKQGFDIDFQERYRSGCAKATLMHEAQLT